MENQKKIGHCIDEDKKVIGILGGMGPLATADLFQKLTMHTKADCDQEHPRVCIDSNSSIPDRTARLLHHGKDPRPEMIASAQRLESIGAEVLIMPCNTAHCFYQDIQRAVHIPILHMIECTRKALTDRNITCAALLATDGTIQTGLYQKHFKNSGIRLLYPSSEGQGIVMELIYCGVKAGNLAYDSSAFCEVCKGLLDQGAQTLILGCTELPLAFSLYQLDYPITDPTLELALSALQFAGCTVK